ncbi:MAG: hypothetical protein ACI4EO_03860 [Blautia sp.]
MKKNVLLLSFIMAVSLCACSQTGNLTDTEAETEEEPVQIPEEEPEKEQEETEEEYDTDLSEKLSDFQFSINETVYQLPSSLKEWESEGWEYKRAVSEETLDSESFLEGEILEREEGSLTVDVVNLEGEKKPLKECYVGGVTLENTKDDKRVYQIPGNLILGKSTLDQAVDVYGSPTDQYEEKDSIYLTYEFGIYKQADLVFDMEEEILRKADLKNYREPEGEEEVSKEKPDSVKNYKAPGAFSEDITDFIVRYGGDFYKIPAPVSQFTGNGWKINGEGSDSSVKAGRHGYVTLERDGQTLYAVVNNYEDQRITVENSFVTNVHGDFDVTKVSVEIYRGITLGMGEDTMKALLGDNEYKTEKTEEGTSYYIYTDKQQQNYTRIFIDKNLKLVREIELSNSPEDIETDGESVAGKDGESVKASVMSGSDTLPGEESEE